jgi:hypothetical protein
LRGSGTRGLLRAEPSGAVRDELERVCAGLIRASEDRREVTLDAIGDAIGARHCTQDEIAEIFDALERAGRRIVGPSGGGAVLQLRRVLAAAREIRGAGAHGRASVEQIAERTGLDPEAVRTALALGRVMGR